MHILHSDTPSPRHEHPAAGLSLAFVGGFLDAYTYLTRGGVFANAQTGNIVLMSLAAARADLAAVGYYLLPILAFFAGVLLSERLRTGQPGHSGSDWMLWVLGLEALLAFVIGWVPVQVPHLWVNTTVSFLCSLQVNTFRKIRGLPYATTMCTGNLRSAAEHFSRFLFAADGASLEHSCGYLLVIALFCLGATAGALAVGFWGIRCIWICGIILLATLTGLAKKEDAE
ncbi:MAG: DUF1275 domain-containing protein [Oscillospiraceae bacterium]|nr:MAG: DUF1275 domain-containing protein [Oscillospiraceae bacterium]